MCYHWGKGVGHLHAHQSTSLSIPNKSSEQLMAIDTLDDPNTEELPGGKEDTHAADTDDDANHESDSLEFTLEDCDFEGWEDVESDTMDDNAHNPKSEDDNESMYN